LVKYSTHAQPMINRMETEDTNEMRELGGYIYDKSTAVETKESE
jgi:hypothetical protein